MSGNVAWIAAVNDEVEENKMPDLITKQDIVLTVANVLMRLGKNDFEGASRQLNLARTRFDEWMRQRPEKQVADLIAEKHTAEEKLAELNQAIRNRAEGNP